MLIELVYTSTAVRNYSDDELEDICRRAFNFDHLCSLNFDQV